jgi:subtilase family serine protease
VSFYLSADGDPNSTAHPPELLGQASLKALRAGRSGKVKLRLALPPAQSASSMYVIGVVDSTNVVAETNEDNNVAVFAVP